jgi:hypothetical protein
MKDCPQCGAWADVLETRKRAGFTYRRLRCANEHKFTDREFLSDATSKAAIQKPTPSQPKLAQSLARKTSPYAK